MTTPIGVFNVAAVLVILIGVLALGIWLGTRFSRANTRDHGLVVANDRAVEVNDAADMLEHYDDRVNDDRLR